MPRPHRKGPKMCYRCKSRPVKNLWRSYCPACQRDYDAERKAAQLAAEMDEIHGDNNYWRAEPLGIAVTEPVYNWDGYGRSVRP